MSKGSTISITYKFKGDNSGLKDLCANVEKMQQAFKDGVAPAEQLKKSLINFNQIADSFAAIGQSMSQLNGIVQELAAAYAVQEEAETKLETVMTQRMSATAEEIQAIKDLTAAQQQLGVVGDEVQIMGAQQLATFLDNSAALTTLIPAMNNLLVQQKGLNATTGDAVAIANLFGKAMQGQTSALRRVGITFSEAEEAAVKNGTEMQRAAALAQIITNNVGEMNAALAQTDSGRAQQLSNALGDVKEQLGGIVAGVAPYTSFIAAIVTTTANAGRAAAAMRGLYTATLGANGAFGFISTTSVASAFGMNAAGVAARFLATGLRMVLAATGIGLVIMGISAAVEYFTRSAEDATAATKELKSETEALEAANQAANQTLVDTRAQLEKDIAATKNFTGTKAQEKKMVEQLNQRYGETMGYFSSVSDWYHTLISNSKAYCQQMVNEARARMIANQIAALKEENYNITHNPDGSTRRYDSTTLKEDKELTSQGAAFAMITDHRAAQRKFNRNTAQINALEGHLEKTVSDKPTMPITGASAPPPSQGTTGGGGGGNNRGGGGGGNDDKYTNNELDAMEQIEAQIRINQKAILTANEEEAADIRKQTIPLLRQKEEMLKKQRDLVELPKEEYTPPQVAEIKTYDELDKALSHYQEQLRKAQPEERDGINSTIKELEKLREAWDNALNPQPPQKTELDTYIEGLADAVNTKFKSMQSPLEGMDFKTLAANYRQIQRVLSGMDGDITKEQRASLQKAAAAYAAYARKAATSYDRVKKVWGQAKNVVSGIDNIKNAIEGNGSAWERLTSAVDGAMQIFEGIRAIVALVQQFSQAQQMLTGATEAQNAAVLAGATAETAAASSKVAAAGAATTANVAEAASGALKANAGIPVVGLALGAAAVAGIIALMASLPKFADGGIAYGATLGIFGEYAGASRNPEVVAPLDRLQRLLGLDGENGGGGALTCRVSGEALEFVLDNRKRKRSRM